MSLAHVIKEISFSDSVSVKVSELTNVQRSVLVFSNGVISFARERINSFKFDYVVIAVRVRRRRISNR